MLPKWKRLGNRQRQCSMGQEELMTENGWDFGVKQGMESVRETAVGFSFGALHRGREMGEGYDF